MQDSPASAIKISALDDYAPDQGWFLKPPSLIHSAGHAARVLVWGNLLAQWIRQEGVTVDLEVVRWSAVLHDLRRQDDGTDPNHGRRAADWIVAGGVPALLALGTERVRQIANCCLWHVPPDSEVPLMTPELLCLKDADALDRARLRGLEVSSLRTLLARLLVPQAMNLFQRSKFATADKSWDAVRRAAWELGFWASDANMSPNKLWHRHACSSC